MTICNTTHSVKRSIPQALRCLEGTTMSNRGHRPRIYDTPLYLCLEGSTPQDGFFLFYHGLDGLNGFEPIEPLELLEPLSVP